MLICLFLMVLQRCVLRFGTQQGGANRRGDGQLIAEQEKLPGRSYNASTLMT